MTLEDFIRKIESAPPEELTMADLRPVRPKPWFLRAGSGKDARIRMLLGSVRYEREPAESTWHLARVHSDLDIEGE
jgi:hypothetical protein